MDEGSVIVGKPQELLHLSLADGNRPLNHFIGLVQVCHSVPQVPYLGLEKNNIEMES